LRAAGGGGAVNLLPYARVYVRAARIEIDTNNIVDGHQILNFSNLFYDRLKIKIINKS